MLVVDKANFKQVAIGMLKANCSQNTVSMMKVLPEADLLEIQNFTKKLLQRHKSEFVDEMVGKFLNSMSREDFMKDIEIAEQEIADGKYSRAVRERG